MSFAEKIRIARGEKKYSQEQLSEKIKVSRQTITKWESESGYPEVKKLIQLAAELQVSIDWLLEDELNELGWRPPVNKESLFIAEDENMAHQKVNDSIVQEAVNKLYNPIIKGKLPTRINCLDLIDGGFSRGGAYYLLGASGIGKIPFAVNIVVNYLRDNRNVMFVLKEHTVQSIMRQILCADADVSFFTKHEEYTAVENQRIRESADFIKNSNLIFDDSYDDSIDRLYEKCINSKQQLDLIVIDSSRLLHTVSENKDEKSRKKRIISIIGNIARECRCVVLVLDRVEKEISELLKIHAKPEEIVEKFTEKSVFTGHNNLIFLNMDDYYVVNQNEKSCLNIVYNDGYHGKGIQSGKCTIKRRTGKIIDFDMSIEDIANIVVSFYKMDLETVKSNKRDPNIVKARQVAMYICHERNYGYREIAKWFLHRDISTVMLACDRIKKALVENIGLAAEINQILKTID